MAELCNEDLTNTVETKPEIIENDLPENVELTGYDDDDDHDDDDDNNDGDNDDELNAIDNSDVVDNMRIYENIESKNENMDFNNFEEDTDTAGLDEQTIQSFLKQLIQLQNQTIIKKKESRLIPSISNFMKLDLDKKSERITPTITRHYYTYVI
ncbi:Hypothetical predicted protein [Paramuricea clavata]|uniref:Uncharacterized protein n=1 Tax=Paramuricea clavata TaxID=317549 RepID=A0A6S7I4W3_PARCT|nr:Hypothetical predicted protein [Paramuricea clavata]